MAELRCAGLVKSYGSRAVLQSVDLEVPEGTLTAILGASGSGKTTLLRAIAGFVELDEGRIEIGETVVADSGVRLPPERRGVGYVTQEGALYPHLKVADNVAFGLSRAERKAGRRTAEVLELVGLDSGFGNRPVHELSGGEQRRVALARALAPRPRLMLLDEPFSALDASLRTDTRRAVLDALAAENVTTVLVTHDQAEALSMGQHVGVLRDGRLIQHDEPSALYTAPADLALARFVGDAVVIPGVVSAGRVSCSLGDLPLAHSAADGPVHVLIRPEQIALVEGSTATVTGSTYFGAETLVQLLLSDADEQAVTARIFSHEAPKLGDPVALDVTAPVVVFPA
ncbi:MAG TPA: ABC transporter ATP-binding protein [Gaiellaceae bacterium]|jgi:iron(III) transport system ATP-binding protein